jgi:dipeptidyl aminopeptidase/acylaminoacyl peptidase
VNYQASDGRPIFAYLTLPHGRGESKLPLIVMPHGGPAARDDAGFDWWAQALASMGYAVLQPQYRGTDGFGWDLLSAGFGEWGKKMQTDLSDGVRALVRQGIVDPARVCIVGGSYGGYAAMAGATIDTGVYRCAASYGGISDLREFIDWKTNRSSEGHLLDRYWARYMGTTGANDPALDAISPIKHLDKETIPLLLVHGKDDTVVPIDQSEDMADAMRRAGKNVTFVKLDGEDHWLSRTATRQAMLKAIADFLRTNNPP